MLLGGYVGVVVYSQPRVTGDRLSITTFFDLARAGRIQEARILDVDSYLVGTYAHVNGVSARYSTPFLKETRTPLLDLLLQSHIPTTIDQQNDKQAVSLLSVLLPTLILAVLLVYLGLSYRRGSGLFGLASGARRSEPGEVAVTFADVAGQDEAVAELREISDFLADPSAVGALGGSVPRGVLLAGPPGCGKTLLARAVAGEARASFFSLAASDFVELYVGVGAARVRDLFREARRATPSIIFIDELDSLGARRSSTALHGNSEREQTVNQILVELDGFSADAAPVIVMAATNRPDLLDPALVRPGRFDRLVSVSLPDRASRRAILTVHARGKVLVPDVDLDAVASTTQGFSGADLANLLNEAALLAARRRLPAIPMSVIDEAVDRTLLGVASRGTVLSPDERRRVAWHEAGHAVLALSLDGSGRMPHKLTITPRGATFGRCVFVESHDRLLDTRSGLLDLMTIGIGGWVAEQIVFGEPSSGTASDLVRVASIARRMVREYGMSDELGPVAISDGTPSDGWTTSERLRQLADAEVQRLVGEARERARTVLTGARESLDRVANALLERETLSFSSLLALADAPGVDRGSPPARSESSSEVEVC